MENGWRDGANWVTKTPLKLEEESNHFQQYSYSLRLRKRKEKFRSGADNYSLRPRKIKKTLCFDAGDDEENYGYEGLKLNKRLSHIAETKNYKPKLVPEDDLFKSFSPGTPPKCAITERAREYISGEREKLDEPSGDGFVQTGNSIDRSSDMDGQSICGDQERPSERSCKRALVFDTENVVNDDSVVEAGTFPYGQTFSVDPNSSEKLGSSSGPSKTLQIYHRRYEKKVQPFFQWHDKPHQVYQRRFKKNQRHNKTNKVRPCFQEWQNKKWKTSKCATEGSKDNPAKNATISVLKKRKFQLSCNGSGPIMKHSKNSQIDHKQKNTLLPFNETRVDTEKVIFRPKVVLDEETLQQWKLRLMMEKSEQESFEINKCENMALGQYNERWEAERELFHGRVISFISRMHLIQGDRQFSQWKGSVVDSVAGVFLAQNVSDNLSSSAFMSLAAQYPYNSVEFKPKIQHDAEGLDAESREGVHFHCHSTSAENITRKLETELMSEKATENTLSCQFGSDIEKIKQEKSSKERGFTLRQWIDRIKRTNGDKRSKEKMGDQQAQKILRRKNADLESEAIIWDNIRKSSAFINPKERSESTSDAVDWRAVHAAKVDEISKAIAERGMDKKLALRIKNFLNCLILEQENVDLEWLRAVPPETAKEYLLNIYGLGLKSAECIRLLALQHQAFPVDTNVGRVLVRLGWVPIQPLPIGQEMHLLSRYPKVNDVHKYLWPRLCTLDYSTLYEFHHQMITFGKAFCTKSNPNCNACPMKAECKHFASAFTSERVCLPAARGKSSANTETDLSPLDIAYDAVHAESTTLTQTALAPFLGEASTSEHFIGDHQNELITYPALECNGETDIEDHCASDIPRITFDRKAFMTNLLRYIDESNLSIEEADMSKALVSATQEAASIPLPKWKNISRLRTEHQVYELPDSHPLLEGLEKREAEDPCPYLLAIRTPGNAASAKPLKEKCQFCNSNETLNEAKKCECFHSYETLNNVPMPSIDPGDNIETVRGTLLIPCRTANRGRFPLNGTFFQVNEVFVDEESSRQPIDVPRAWIWNLPRKTLYCGTSIRAIFKGMSTEEVQNCFWRGYICLRRFNRKTREPGPLPLNLHRPISKGKKIKR